MKYRIFTSLRMTNLGYSKSQVYFFSITLNPNLYLLNLESINEYYALSATSTG
jgi:hypothetical protein